MADWTKPEDAGYLIAGALGICPEPEAGPDWYLHGGKQDLFYSSNPFCDSLCHFLVALTKCGVLETDEGTYRWNPHFDWETFNSEHPKR